MTSVMTFLTTYWYVPVAVVALVVYLVVKNKSTAASTAALATPVALAVPVTPVAPVTTVSAILPSSFPAPNGAAALRAAIISEKINYQVVLDQVQINGGFGPAQFFYTQKDGSVSTTPVAASAVNTAAIPVAPVAQTPADVIASTVVTAAPAPAVTAPAVRNQYSSTNFSDKYPAASCNQTDAFYLWAMRFPFKVAVQSKYNGGEIHFCILSGTQTDINRVINVAANDFPSEAVKFNPVTYTGPLKTRYEALVAGIMDGSIIRKNFYSDNGQPV